MGLYGVACTMKNAEPEEEISEKEIKK